MRDSEREDVDRVTAERDLLPASHHAGHQARRRRATAVPSRETRRGHAGCESPARGAGVTYLACSDPRSTVWAALGRTESPVDGPTRPIGDGGRCRGETVEPAEVLRKVRRRLSGSRIYDPRGRHRTDFDAAPLMFARRGFRASAASSRSVGRPFRSSGTGWGWMPIAQRLAAYGCFTDVQEVILHPAIRARDVHIGSADQRSDDIVTLRSR